MNRLKPIVSGVILLLIILALAFSPLAGRLRVGLVDRIKIPLSLTHSISLRLKEVLGFPGLFGDNRRLRRERDLLTAKLIELKEASLENERLRGLLSFKKEKPQNSLAALVIGRDISSWNSTLLINRGRRDGLKVNMPVVSLKGIVGRVVEVSYSTAEVILITHPDFRISAIAQETREKGLVYATVDKRLCVMRYLPLDSEVSVGDMVVSSGLGKIYPKGLLIGKVTVIDIDQRGMYKNAFITPAVNLSQLEEVLVITDNR